MPESPKLADFDQSLQNYKAQVQAEIAQEAATAGMTVEEYAAAGFEAPQQDSFSMLPYKSLHLSSVKDRFGIYALIDKNENRDKNIRKPRASIRKQLSETKQAASPKKAAAHRKQYEMEV